MSTIVTRAGKGSPLTNTELDSNFSNLNTDKLELSGGTLTGNINFGDGDVATFNSNLNIFSTGTSSYIEEVGAGDLYLKASNLYITDRENNQFISMIDNGAGGTISLKHLGSTKIATTATGADITGVLTADGLTVSNGTNTTAIPATSDRVSFTATSSYIQSTGSFYVQPTGDLVLNGTGSEIMRLKSSKVGINNSNPATALDVSGTITADGLTVDSGTYHKLVSTFPATYTTNLQIGQQGNINNNALTDTLLINHNAQATQSNVLFNINNKSVLKLQEGGDISFYNSAGTSQNLFWDSSTSRLGLGTTAPQRTLETKGVGVLLANTGGAHEILFGDNAHRYFSLYTPSSPDSMAIRTGTTDLLTINADGSSVFSGSVTSTGNSLFTGNINVTGSTTIGSTAAPLRTLDSRGSGMAIFGTGSYTEIMLRERSGTTRNVGAWHWSVRGDVGGNNDDLKLLRFTSGSYQGVAMQVATATGNASFSGSVTSTGLSVASTGASTIELEDTDNGFAATKLNVENGGRDFKITTPQDTIFVQGSTEAMRIDTSNNVGIGTTSPSAKLDVQGGLAISNSSASRWTLDRDNTNGSLTFTDSYINEAMRLTATGLGIGTTETPRPLTVNGLAGFRNSTTGFATSDGFDIGVGGSDAYIVQRENANIIIETNGSERTRIASNGTLYHGKTADSLNTGGLQTLISGQTSITQSYTEPLRLNRMSTQGAIQKFYYNGAEVGSIGVMHTNNMYFTGASGHGGLQFGTANVTPLIAGSESNGGVDLGASNLQFKDLYLSGKIYGSTLGIGDAGIQADQYSNAVKPFRPDITSGTSDNYLDLGTSSVRWVDIYATNGTIQTSDRNEKQDIEELSEAEERVAIAAKGLLKKFRWKDAVEDKGDDARIHFGIIAQDLQDAFEAEGLDAGRYGMFTSNTWTNEDGEEQTRMGVRYSELLAFIISAI